MSNMLNVERPLAPVPATVEDLIIEALRHANLVGILLNELAAACDRFNEQNPNEAFDQLSYMLERRFSDCSAVHLFVAANALKIKLTEDLIDDTDPLGINV